VPESTSLPEAASGARLLVPPPPIAQAESNWPLLTVSRGFFEGVAPVGDQKTTLSAATVDIDTTDGGLVLVDEGGKGATGAEGEEGYFVPPPRGVPPTQSWTQASALVADHVMAGSFESAARLLNDQLGIVNVEPFRSLFMVLHARSRTSFTALPSLPSLPSYPSRTPPALAAGRPPPQLPAVPLKLNDLVGRLQVCYQLTTAGKFSESVDRFRGLLLSIPFLIVDSKQELVEVQELLTICREYINGLQLEIARKELAKTPANAIRVAEMAAYFTHVQVQPAHQVLTLRTALNICFKLKCYRTASSLARRLLDLGPKPEIANQARKILQVCDKNPTDEQQLKYDEHNPFSVCGISYTPIYRGKPEEKCPFCQVSFCPEHKGKLCPVCTVAEVGKDGSGLRISAHQGRS
ncbi:unnamed protein product, partial [Cyprideis torosa]